MLCHKHFFGHYLKNNLSQVQIHCSDTLLQVRTLQGNTLFACPIRRHRSHKATHVKASNVSFVPKAKDFKQETFQINMQEGNSQTKICSEGCLKSTLAFICDFVRFCRLTDLKIYFIKYLYSYIAIFQNTGFPSHVLNEHGSDSACPQSSIVLEGS